MTIFDQLIIHQKTKELLNWPCLRGKDIVLKQVD